MKILGGISLEANEVTLISNNYMKIWCTLTLKDYDNLVYCDVAVIFHMFFLSNNIQITV